MLKSIDRHRAVAGGLVLLAAVLWLGACSGGDDDDGGGGSTNSAPVLEAPDAAAGDIVIGGADPSFTGACALGDNLALSFLATDADAGNTLTTTITVSAGTLTAAQAGFSESFPYAPAGAASPHNISLTGTAANLGTIELTVSVDDGNGGTDQITFLLTIANSAPVLSAPNASAGDIVLAGSIPAFTGDCQVGDNLALSFQATDADAGNTLTTTITVTGGTLTGSQAGFSQSFPYAPAGTTSPHTISLSGTAANPGTISLTIDVIDGQGGSDQVTLTIAINAAPVLSAPNASAGDIVIAGSDPTFTGACLQGDDLALSFAATDGNAGDTLTTTITITGGTLSGAQAGFTESFPYSPAGSASPHMIALTGTALDPGTIQFSIDVTDGQGGTDQITLLITIAGSPVLASPSASGAVKVVGADPTYAGSIGLTAGLGLDFTATDPDAGDTLVTTITVTGGTLTAAQAGFSETFPYSPAGAVSPHTISLTGTSASRGTIQLTIDVDDGQGGTDLITLWLRIGGSTFDFNGDGFEDVCVGATLDDDGGTESGAAFIFFGSATPSAVIDASVADVSLIGGDAGDNFGWSIASAGDFNGDGYDDVIVGAFADDDGGSQSGVAFIFFGSATPPSIIDATAANVRLVGADSGDFFGVDVAGAGDVNGDGYADVVVGADLDDDGGSSSGAAFIFFGSATPPGTIDASAANVSLVGADAFDAFGWTVSSAGDFNGDGYSDVLVAAQNDDDGGSRSGVAFIFFGAASMSATIDASNADVTLVGADANDIFGYSCALAGDVNGDGYADVIVGAHWDDDGGASSGSAFVFFGSATPPTTIDASNADIILVGADPNDNFGDSVASAGDFNGDGYDDVAVGARLDDDGGPTSGSAFIFFGSATPPATIDASAADVTLVGGNPSDQFGFSASSAGDFNGDGFEDVIVAAQWANNGGPNSGAAYIFFGSATSAATIPIASADVTLVGADADDNLGSSVGGG